MVLYQIPKMFVWCVFGGGIVDEATYATLCAALDLGLETIECLVLGP